MRHSGAKSNKLQHVLETIQERYVMAFCIEPLEYFQPNQSFALANTEFVTEAIDELLEDAWLQHTEVQHTEVQRTEVEPHVCSPLSVIASGAGKETTLLKKNM